MPGASAVEAECSLLFETIQPIVRTIAELLIHAGPGAGCAFCVSLGTVGRIFSRGRPVIAGTRRPSPAVGAGVGPYFGIAYITACFTDRNGVVEGAVEQIGPVVRDREIVHAHVLAPVFERCGW